MFKAATNRFKFLRLPRWYNANVVANSNRTKNATRALPLERLNQQINQFLGFRELLSVTCSNPLDLVGCGKSRPPRIEPSVFAHQFLRFLQQRVKQCL